MSLIQCSKLDLMKNAFLPFVIIFAFTPFFLHAQNQTVTLTISFDQWAYEVGWQIKNSSGADAITPVVPGAGNGFPNNQSQAFTYSLAPGNYTLVMIDSYGDGFAPGSFSLTVSGQTLASGSGDYDGNNSNNNNSTSVNFPFSLGSSCSGNANPAATISSSASTVTTGTSFSLSAGASDANGNNTITKVEFYKGATKIGEDLTSPYSYVQTESTAGTYSYTARAIDNCSGQGNSTAVSVTVNTPCGTNVAPSVSISQPANNSTATSGTNLQINASATDSDGSISQVQFYNGTNLLGTSTSSPYSYIYTSIPAGTYTFTAKATDNCGAVTTSSVITVTVSSGGGSSCNPWALNCTTTGDISRTGRVGIGTGNFLSDASYLLYVKGGIRAEKVQLELSSTGGWADYVFAPDYKLMPLKQVAEYLKTYRHLPGMASEAEMKAEGGINVGKIAGQQQAKIEELFLYVIEVNKKVEHLQTELEQLRKENQSLRKQAKK